MPPTWCRVIRLSMSDTFQPVMPDILENIVAATPAKITPARVPAVAHSVFFVAPPIKYRVTAAVMEQINTEVQKGEYPI